jgi:polar amino acid transport system substrate-binding protein
MKKIVALLLTLSMCFGLLSGCGSSGSKEAAAEQPAGSAPAASGAAEGGDALTTVTEGKLTVATSPDFAPYEFYALDENNTPTLAGFDVALAQYIADYMGLELEMVTVDFDGVLSELQTGNVDLGMAGLSPDPKREAVMDFSDIYYEGGQSLVTVKANADKITSFEDINSSEFTVGAQTGSIQLDLANANTPNANIVSMPKVTDIISELLAGKEFAAFIETDVAKSYQKNYPDLEIVMDVPYDQEGSAIGVNKGNAALLAKVNEAIAAAKEDGSLENFIAEANEQASGDKYEGLLDENGAAPAEEASAE